MDASRLGVIFDCDGTLLDSMGSWRQMEHELARRAGVTLTKRDSDLITTLTLSECARLYHERFGLGRDEHEVEGMIEDFMLDFYGNRSALRPGARALLEQLTARGAHMSVASSTPGPWLAVALRHCGVQGFFDVVLSVDDVGASKREPLIYERAREAMGTSLANTWGVEDAVYAVRTLRGAGFRTLAIYDCDWSGTCEQLAAEADHLIRSFCDVDVDTLLSWTDGS